jgi:hypothetical protein
MAETYLACHLMALHAMSRQVLLLEAPNEISLAWMVKRTEEHFLFLLREEDRPALGVCDVLPIPAWLSRSSATSQPKGK